MVDETKKSIREGLISLLYEKEYNEIHMKEIAQRSNIGRRTLYRYFNSKEDILKYTAESLLDHFAEEIEKENNMSLQTIIHAFFVFMKKYKVEFMLLKKARLLSYIEDRLPELIAGVAAKTKYKGRPEEEVPFLGATVLPKDKYYFYFVFAGFWRVAIAWLEEEEGLSPEQMAEITLAIMKGQG